MRAGNEGRVERKRTRIRWECVLSFVVGTQENTVECPLHDLHMFIKCPVFIFYLPIGGWLSTNVDLLDDEKAPANGPTRTQEIGVWITANIGHAIFDF